MHLKISLLLSLLLLTGIALRSQEIPGNEVIDYSNPVEYTLGGVTVTGVKYLDGNVMAMLSGLSVGDKVMVPGDKIASAIRKLWDQGLFEDIKIKIDRIQDNLIFLNIELKERPRLSKFAFSGIKNSEADNIREKIKLVKGDVVTDNLVNRTSNIMRQYFIDKGYLNVEVKVTQKRDSASASDVVLVFDIDKNSRIRIYQINVYGNENLSTQRIKNAFKKTKEKGYFNPLNDLEKMIYQAVQAALRFNFEEIATILENQVNNNLKLRIFKSSKFIEEEYEEGKINLIDKYNSMGFRDARIVRDSVYRYGDDMIAIDLYMDEGKKYYFRNISWIGNTKYSDQFLSNILKINKGDVYNQELLSTYIDYNPNGGDISSLYMDDGYLFFSATPVETAIVNDSIDIEIQIYEGKQATISKVTLKGNTKTNDHVAIREMYTLPGQLFSRDKLIRTQRQLGQLRYFDAEKLQPNIITHPEDATVDLEYQVEEASSDQIELSGGWGYGRIIGSLGLSFNNFSLRNVLKKSAWNPIPAGDGQKLGIRVQSYGKGYISYSVSFTEPWLGGRKPLSFSVAYYHSLYSNGLSRSDTNRASFTINGVTIGLGQMLKWPDDYFSLSQSITYQNYKLKKYTTIFDFGDGNGTFHDISYTLALSRNSVNHPIFPKDGSEVTTSLELTPPYSLFRNNPDYSTWSANRLYEFVEYYKLKIKAAFYINLIDKFVLTPRFQFGFLGAYNNKIGITPFERFYLGGDGLSGYNNLDGRELIGLRGYGNNTLTPGYPNGKGGTAYSKYTFELRYPISMSQSATIYALTFLEAGNDWSSFKYFNPFDVYRSTGFGIRVWLPMFGLLGLDWGYGLDVVPGVPGANRGQFHFSINQSID
ncbi:MAG: outer membrane protein assembly factor BamA [Bacteroidetes bacterium]|nr:outer membrane protein assembly factor BamA [Bacteroidota bacterium]